MPHRFSGEISRKLDYKNRLAIPEDVVLDANEGKLSHVLVIRGKTEGEPAAPFLSLYELEDWRAIVESASKSLQDPDEMRLFMHHHAADAQRLDVDNMRRVTLPAPLLQYAKIDKEVKVVGFWDHIEVWAVEEHQAYLGMLEREGVPFPSIADLSRYIDRYGRPPQGGPGVGNA